MRRASLVLAVLAGCYSAGVKVTEKQVKSFTPGVTTYADVVKELGDPSSVQTYSDGRRSAIYSYMMAKAKAASFIPVVGLFAGGADSRHTMTTFNFAPDGKLIDYATSDGSVAAGMGTAGRATPRKSEDAQPATASAEPLPVSCSEAGAMRCNGSAVQACSDKAWRTTDTCASGQECSESKLYCSEGACCH